MASIWAMDGPAALPNDFSFSLAAEHVLLRNVNYPEKKIDDPFLPV